jgi:hypothetical protein
MKVQMPRPWSWQIVLGMLPIKTFEYLMQALDQQALVIIDECLQEENH